VESFGCFEGEGHLDFGEVFGFVIRVVAAQAQRRFSR
jgi:hypothetical protein